MESTSEPTLGEVIRRLIRIEDRMDRSFVGAQVYEAEKSAAIEARQNLKAQLDGRLKAVESTLTWLLRLIIGVVVTGIVGAIVGFVTGSLG